MRSVFAELVDVRPAWKRKTRPRPYVTVGSEWEAARALRFTSRRTRGKRVSEAYVRLRATDPATAQAQDEARRVAALFGVSIAVQVRQDTAGTVYARVSSTAPRTHHEAHLDSGARRALDAERVLDRAEVLWGTDRPLYTYRYELKARELYGLEAQNEVRRLRARFPGVTYAAIHRRRNGTLHVHIVTAVHPSEAPPIAPGEYADRVRNMRGLLRYLQAPGDERLREPERASDRLWKNLPPTEHARQFREAVSEWAQALQVRRAAGKSRTRALRGWAGVPATPAARAARAAGGARRRRLRALEAAALTACALVLTLRREQRREARRAATAAHRARKRRARLEHLEEARQRLYASPRRLPHPVRPRTPAPRSLRRLPRPESWGGDRAPPGAGAGPV